MERLWVYYYTFLLVVLIGGVAYYTIPGVISSMRATSQEHHIGVNFTKINNTCRIIWLGGWDFDSLYSNVTVNGVNVGHPKPVTTIYNDTCKDLTVKMHDKTVDFYWTVYQYNHTGGI